MTFGGAGITEPVFQWIRAKLPDGKHILELGSGDVSTQYLSAYYRLTSVEDKAEFLNRYPSRYIHAPLVDGWYDTTILEALPKDYDLILVDGPVGSEPREGFLRNLRLFRTDVPIVIDDTWREVERKMAAKLALATGGYLEIFERFSVLTPASVNLIVQNNLA